MPWTFALDIVIAALMAMIAVYAVVLSRRLDAARRDWVAIEQHSQAFTLATARAAEAAVQLKADTAALHGEIVKSEGLKEDLRDLIERAVVAADRLEEGVRRARDIAPPRQGTKPARTAAVMPSSKPMPRAMPRPGSRSQAEQALLDALERDS